MKSIKRVIVCMLLLGVIPCNASKKLKRRKKEHQLLVQQARRLKYALGAVESSPPVLSVSFLTVLLHDKKHIPQDLIGEILKFHTVEDSVFNRLFSFKETFPQGTIVDYLEHQISARRVQLVYMPKQLLPTLREAKSNKELTDYIKKLYVCVAKGGRPGFTLECEDDYHSRTEHSNMIYEIAKANLVQSGVLTSDGFPRYYTRAQSDCSDAS